MIFNKQKYWRVDNILSTGADYLMAIGERSNGKSYAIKEHLLKNAYLHGHEFILLRRNEIDLRASDVCLYFQDMDINAITGGDWQGVECKGRQIVFYTSDDLGKLDRSKPIGYTMALSKSQNYKSQAYPNVQNIVFEEFMSESGRYLPNEISLFNSVVSTVFRRRQGKVWLIGNKILRVCPYFSEWQLTGIKNQKIGTIDIYNFTTEQENDDGSQVTVKIAVENCENSGKNTKMIFGMSEKSIAGGEWEVKAYPKLPRDMSEYECPYIFHVEFDDFRFKCYYFVGIEDGVECIYIKPHTRKLKADDRIISNRHYDSPYYTTSFYEIIREESRVFDILDNKAVYFSDNLTGADFFGSLKSLTGRR